MSFLSDLMLAVAALGAGFFCWILSRRLSALTALDSGLGKTIAVLSVQVDDLSRALSAARESAEGSAGHLDTRITRAEDACRQLDLLLAALHDLPASPPAPHRPAEPDLRPLDDAELRSTGQPPNPWPPLRPADPAPAAIATPRWRGRPGAQTDPVPPQPAEPQTRARILRRRTGTADA